MHIYHPFDFALGILALLAGPLLLVSVISRVLARTFKNVYADWRMVAMGAWLTTAGSAHLSRSLDPPHLVSPRTALLICLEIAVLLIIALVYAVAWIVRWRCKRSA